MEQYNQYPEMYRPALTLLIPLWRGLSGEYKQKYARNIWEQFEDNIRAAAYTSRLSKFYNSICSRLEITLTASDLPDIFAGITATDEKLLLRQLREETATLVLMVRLENEARKSEWKARQEARTTELTKLNDDEIKGLWS